MHGYMGKILRVDLSSGKISTEELDSQMVHEYIGGGGFATKIVYDEVPAGTDPLGGDNRVVFMTGPVTGTRFPTSGRFVVAAKSPLTNMLTTAASSGFWGVELKKTGYDGIDRKKQQVEIKTTQANSFAFRKIAKRVICIKLHGTTHYEVIYDGLGQKLIPLFTAASFVGGKRPRIQKDPVSLVVQRPLSITKLQKIS